MNKVVTSRQEIINASRELASEHGLAAISIRRVASVCGVSIGSIYNYFTDKAELVTAVIESVWMDVFHMSGECSGFRDFTGCVVWLYDCIRKGTREYPEFFTTHAAGLSEREKDQGRQVMSHYFVHMKMGLSQALHNDSEVREDLFDDGFTEPEFIEFVFTNILGGLMQKGQSCAVLIEVIKRIIY